MSETTTTFARLGCSLAGSAGRVRVSTPAVSLMPTAHTAVVATYKPFIGARNDAQGGASAWSPPV
jgi:hypothetical protein